MEAEVLEPVQPIPEKTRLISLNLVYDYPVFWSKYKVLRDFAQNFYDSVGMEEWNEKFHWSFENKTIAMEVDDVSFSYEWLVPIGASTKRDDGKRHAGYFGEGFKLASLNALRDYGWDVSAASSDWELKVTSSQIIVDGKPLKSLAYELGTREYSSKTSLIIRRADVSEDLVQAVMLSFYYPENILLGEKLWENISGAIYTRSSAPLPKNSFKTPEFGAAGIIFASYQNLGSIDVPFVFANHTFRKDDRDRNGLYDFDIIELIRDLIPRVDPETSLLLLEHMEDRWHDYPNGRYDLHSFNAVITMLAGKVASSKTVAEKFMKAHPNLLAAKEVRKKDIVSKNRRNQALSWKANCGVKYKLVQINFQEIGYPTLEEECEKNGGYSLVKCPDPLQAKYMQVMEDYVNTIYGASYFGFESLPECRIILNEEASWAGMATCFPLSSKSCNKLGRKLKFTMNTVAVKGKYLKKDCFATSVSIYIHELCHVFGKDKSANFSAALSEAMQLQLSNIAALLKARIAWSEVEGDAVIEEGQIPEVFGDDKESGER
ncbi:MAG: hypothetical protein LBT59_22205 [Clostridiales bacterium]|jgi:hypothetical protein|nr:hypothetical protein [Clostridiales bacterium]